MYHVTYFKSNASNKNIIQKSIIFLRFQAFLGDRYGHRPLPPKIDDAEFDALLTMLDGNQEGKDLLCRWYYKDDNSIPPVYILQVRRRFIRCVCVCGGGGGQGVLNFFRQYQAGIAHAIDRFK